MFKPLLKIPVVFQEKSVLSLQACQIGTPLVWQLLGLRDAVATKVVATDLTKDVLFGNGGVRWAPLTTSCWAPKLGEWEASAAIHRPFPNPRPVGMATNVMIIPWGVWKLGTLKTTENLKNHLVIILPSLKPTYSPWKLVFGRHLGDCFPLEKTYFTPMLVLGRVYRGWFWASIQVYNWILLHGSCTNSSLEPTTRKSSNHYPWLPTSFQSAFQLFQVPATTKNSDGSTTHHNPSAKLHLFARANGPTKTWAQRAWKSHFQRTGGTHFLCSQKWCLSQLPWSRLGFGSFSIEF